MKRVYEKQTMRARAGFFEAEQQQVHCRGEAEANTPA